MNKDEYGEVINGKNTYTEIANDLKEVGKSVLIGWTDQNSTHFDILFTFQPKVEGTNIQGGVRGTDLFVSIMRRGAFGFEIANEDTHESYYDEKLGGGLGSTAEKLAELINEIKKLL